MSDNSILQGLLSRVAKPSPFSDSQFPYPLNQSLFGQLDLEALRHRTSHANILQVVDELPLFLALAEVVEASQPDKKNYFIADRELRARLLRLNSTDGWVLLIGKENEQTSEVAKVLQQEHLQVYVTLTDDITGQSPLRTDKQFKFLGNRSTSSVYFYQALVRYAHIYGRIPLGDAHEVSEFIQENGPGVMVLTEDKISPETEKIFLGGLYLGIPAVVPPSFSLPYGATVRADDPAQITSAALSFPNLRLRRHLRFQVNIPYNFDPAFVAEEISEGLSVGGTPLSSFVVTNTDKGDGIEIDGEPGNDIGIEIAAGDRRVDISMTDYLEEFAAQLPGYIQGVSSQVKDGCPTIRWHADIPFQMAQLAQVYYDGLKAHFKIDRLKVRLVFNPDMLVKMKAEAESFRDKRKKALAAASEETEPFFYACTRCHSFALEHACTITPERPPQCGSRTWMHVKTRAMLSDFDSGHLGKVQSGPALQAVVEKERCLDEVKGEFAGVNASTEILTEGRTKRIFLHSIFGHPHTACSCFQGVAFHIAEVDGIGLIDRTFKGTAPDGRGWEGIANAAAGKQSSGYAAFSKEYLKSRKFLRGDGGWNRVVWMPKELKNSFAADKPWIATEADVSNIRELIEFLETKRKFR